MLETENFVVSINQAGAPLVFYSYPITPESMWGMGKNLWASREKLAKLYWLMHSFEVRYDFQIGPYRSQRNFTVNNQHAKSLEPQQRVNWWPEFNLKRTRDPNPNIKVEYTVWTDLANSVEVKPDLYAVTLEVTERDFQSEFIFTTLLQKDFPYHHCMCTFPFVFAEIETAVHIYIAKTVKKKWACKINHFEIIPTFWTVKLGK